MCNNTDGGINLSGKALLAKQRKSVVQRLGYCCLISSPGSPGQGRTITANTNFLSRSFGHKILLAFLQHSTSDESLWTSLKDQKQINT